jgi:hypothetical protein
MRIGMKYRLKSTDWTNHLRKTGFNVTVDHFFVYVIDKNTETVASRPTIHMARPPNVHSAVEKGSNHNFVR